MNFSYIVPSPFITLLKLSAQHSWRHGGHVAQTNFMRYCSGSFHCSQITLGLFFKASPATHLFIWKLVFICMWIKTNFHMKGWASGLDLKKRQKVIRKWPIYICNRVKETFQTWTASLMANLLTEVILTLSSFCGTQPTTSPNDKEPYLQKTGMGVWQRKTHKYVNKGAVRLRSKFCQAILQTVQSIAD